MKWENKQFLLIFERKRERKHKESKKKGRMIAAVLLIFCLVAGGGGIWLAKRSEPLPALTEKESQNTEVPQSELPKEAVEGTYLESTYLAGNIKDKYETSPYGYTYGEPVKGLQRSDTIILKAEFNLEDYQFSDWREILEIYTDPALTHSIAGSAYEYDGETGSILIRPANYPIGGIGINNLRTDTVHKYEHDDLFLFPRDAGTSWGNLSTLYVALHVDLKTGQTLDVPAVSVVTFKGEIAESPRIKYAITADGRTKLSWQPIEGAEEYFICKIRYSAAGGLSGGLFVLDTTTETSWTPESELYGSIVTNTAFKTYKACQDDWFDEYSAERMKAEYGEIPIAVTDEDDWDQYCVIAVNEEGSSMMSNLLDAKELAENLPSKLALSTWKENGYTYNKYETAESTAPYGYVTMCDGNTSAKLINYITERAAIVEDRYISTDENGDYVEGNNIAVLKIPYVIEGTPFEDTALILDYDSAGLEKDLAFIEEREAMLRKKAGDIGLNAGIAYVETIERPSQAIRQTEAAQITANSALSEYLAVSMLGNTTIIDLSQFSEAADLLMVEDALMEAYYQNPLILGISGYRVSKSGDAMKVLYDYDAEVTVQKQNEIRQKVAEITAGIIQPGMSELEKELAINEYLFDTIEYDDAALANAEENEFKSVDERFMDSFTAYGALINGKCVCAGYAGAFKLLADAAGLDSIVVTGILEGGLNHAWNKVSIDGEWQILDVTNNDMEFLNNALLNLPEEAGRNTLTEDDAYLLNACISQYLAEGGEKEYYRISDKYFPYDKIAYELARDLKKDGRAVLRTEYELDDETFNQIVQSVFPYIDSEDLYGFYWMGVIYLSSAVED